MDAKDLLAACREFLQYAGSDDARAPDARRALLTGVIAPKAASLTVGADSSTENGGANAASSSSSPGNVLCLALAAACGDPWSMIRKPAVTAAAAAFKATPPGSPARAAFVDAVIAPVADATAATWYVVVGALDCLDAISSAVDADTCDRWVRDVSLPAASHVQQAVREAAVRHISRYASPQCVENDVLRRVRQLLRGPVANCKSEALQGGLQLANAFPEVIGTSLLDNKAALQDMASANDAAVRQLVAGVLSPTDENFIGTWQHDTRTHYALRLLRLSSWAACETALLALDSTLTRALHEANTKEVSAHPYASPSLPPAGQTSWGSQSFSSGSPRAATERSVLREAATLIARVEELAQHERFETRRMAIQILPLLCQVCVRRFGTTTVVPPTALLSVRSGDATTTSATATTAAGSLESSSTGQLHSPSSGAGAVEPEVMPGVIAALKSPACAATAGYFELLRYVLDAMQALDHPSELLELLNEACQVSPGLAFARAVYDRTLATAAIPPLQPPPHRPPIVPLVEAGFSSCSSPAGAGASASLPASPASPSWEATQSMTVAIASSSIACMALLDAARFEPAAAAAVLPRFFRAPSYAAEGVRPPATQQQQQQHLHQHPQSLQQQQQQQQKASAGSTSASRAAAAFTAFYTVDCQCAVLAAVEGVLAAAGSTGLAGSLDAGRSITDASVGAAPGGADDASQPLLQQQMQQQHASCAAGSVSSVALATIASWSGGQGGGIAGGLSANNGRSFHAKSHRRLFAFVDHSDFAAAELLDGGADVQNGRAWLRASPRKFAVAADVDAAQRGAMSGAVRAAVTVAGYDLHVLPTIMDLFADKTTDDRVLHHARHALRAAYTTAGLLSAEQLVATAVKRLVAVGTAQWATVSTGATGDDNDDGGDGDDWDASSSSSSSCCADGGGGADGAAGGGKLEAISIAETIATCARLLAHVSVDELPPARTDLADALRTIQARASSSECGRLDVTPSRTTTRGERS